MSRGALDASGRLPAGPALDDEVSSEADDAHPVQAASGAPGAGGRRGAGGRSPWWPWVVLAVVLTSALVVGSTGVTGPSTDAERANSLARTLLCPECAGQTVAESDIIVSREIRRDILRRIEEGQTDEAIRQAYVDAYGQDILASPPTSGTSALVWALPVLGLAAAGVGLWLAFRRWRVDGGAAVSDADRSLVAAALASSPGEHPGEGRGATGARGGTGGEEEDRAGGTPPPGAPEAGHAPSGSTSVEDRKTPEGGR